MKSVILFLLGSILLTSTTLSYALTAHPSITAVECSLSGGDSNTLIPPRREVYGNGRIIDITHRYTPDMPSHVFDHYYDAGFDIDTLDLDVLNGPALSVDVPRDKNITAEVMKSLKIQKGVRCVLFRTLNTDRQLMFKNQFDTSYVGFMKDGAKWLVENTDIKLEIILVEALKLDDIQPGIYSVHCLPLRLQGAEGSPIRCILIK
ncbi:hypothetical protein M0R45_007709 [Rubus argutus]|uniref:Uncharacterized protein n=1 Tax=Rubus argutus TaxID=59490 RepID=A0AAW1XZH2_RUBAR